MDLYKEGVEVLILPDTARCRADEDARRLIDTLQCPFGDPYCDSDCEYYEE